MPNSTIGKGEKKEKGFRDVYKRQTMDNVIKTTVFLTDINDFAAMNEVYAAHFGGDYPARSAVEVGALPKGAKVEIETICIRG